MKHLRWFALLALIVRGEFARCEEPTFEQHVRPIFKAYCFECHGEGEKLRGGLDLRLRRLTAQGGDNGPSFVPGQSDKSLLLERVRKHEMPPGKVKLPPAAVATIERWIATGAKTARPEPTALTQGVHFTPDERAYWAFQPVKRPNPPLVKATGNVRNAVDAFLLSKLEAKGFGFAPEADRRTLIRRVYFDLVGLPPTPEEVAAFVADRAPHAYERLIDRLLDSPHYGERWGRHWLDVAGYADSEGYATEDKVRPDAWKYRDYVIRAFNSDKPFDQFLTEQLAGDELLPRPLKNLAPDAIDKLTATGYLRMAPDGTGSGGVDQNEARNAVVADTLKIVSTSLLGLTVGCAQCHNHRYDPIPQTDYYRLRALLEPALNWKNWQAPAGRRVSLQSDADRAATIRIEDEARKIEAEYIKQRDAAIEKTFEKELAKLPENVRQPIRDARKTPAAKQTTEQKNLLKAHPSTNVDAGSLYLYEPGLVAELKKITDRAAALRATKPTEEFVRALVEPVGPAPTTVVFKRGDITAPGQTVNPGGLSILDASDPLLVPAASAGAATTGRRLALARWLTDGKHPLTARVLVNRVWHHHFGKGIVATPGEFGFLGDRPSHPELLDWLADEFIASGWRLKRLHKLLLTSTAYRQSSRRDPAKERIDPDNRLLGRMPVRRLEAEAVRDAVLAVTGKLNGKLGGPPVPVTEDEVGQFILGKDNRISDGTPGKIAPLEGDEFRRSVYVQVRRSRPYAVLDTFDAPTMEPNCECRNASTVTPQALLFLNNEFVVSHADHLAARAIREAAPELAARVRRAWELAFGVAPSAEQLQDAITFIGEQTELLKKSPPHAGKPAAPADPARQALASFCQTLLCANAFLYVD